MLGNDIFNQHLSAGRRHGGHIGPRLNLIGDNRVSAAAQFVHALDLDGIRPRAAHIGPHGVQEIRQIDDMRLFRGVFNHGRSLRRRGGHHDIHRRADGYHVQIEIRAFQMVVSGSRVDKAALYGDAGPQSGKALDMLIDRTHAAEGTAAGHRHFRLSEAPQQGADEIIGSADFLAEVVVRAHGTDAGTVNLHGMEIQQADGSAQLFQQTQQQRHVGDLRHVFDPADATHQQGRGKNRNRRVFCPADLYLSKQGLPALNNVFRQIHDPLFKQNPDLPIRLPRRDRFPPVNSLPAGFGFIR